MPDARHRLPRLEVTLGNPFNIVPADIFPGFDLNHSYEDCDAFVSIAKLKEHAVAGVTLSMKNCFGITPATIYGTGSGKDEPTELPSGGRQIIHSGARQPSKSAPQEKDLTIPGKPATACHA